MTNERVRITGPRDVDRTRYQRKAVDEIGEETPIGQIYMQSLIEYQLRIAGATAGLVVLILGSLPLLFIFTDWWKAMSLFGIPLVWLILGVFVYPLIILVAWVYLRRVEKAEADFVRLVEEP